MVGPGQRDWLHEAIALQAHRGPDASGFMDFGSCALGHNRLRIMDLRPEADQPMSGEDDQVWVVFNGEIYNYRELRSALEHLGHRFRTDSDTEVLVHGYEEYGDDLLGRLRGMFSLAVWDSRASTLLLARDRFGIKPLYYVAKSAALRFASEARVLAEGSELDRVALAGYLRMGWVSGPRTIFAGVSELPPGHLLRWTQGSSQVLPWAETGVGSEQTGTTAGLREALRDAVGRHLVSDVPVGLFLSAGVDSVALAEVASDLGSGVRCFTVGFEDSGGAHDETETAAGIARRLGLEHQVIPVQASDVLSQLGGIVSSMDQPSVDGVNTWVISQVVRQAGMTVALSGLGGDELFSGYSTYRQVPRLVRVGRLGAVLPDRVRARTLHWADAGIGDRRLRRAAEAVLTGGSRAAYAAMRGVTGASELAALVDDDDGLADITAQHGHGTLGTVLGLEMENYLPNQLLRDTDAMSMAHSLEVRVPLLDDRVVAEALRGPADEVGRSGKARLAAAAGPMATEAASRAKGTFTLPFEAWIKGPLRQLAREASIRLCEPDVGLARPGVESLWQRWEAGRSEWRTIWALAALGLWVDRDRSGRIARARLSRARSAEVPR